MRNRDVLERVLGERGLSLLGEDELRGMGVEDLRKYVDAVSGVRNALGRDLAVVESRLEGLKVELEGLRREAREAFGCDDLDGLGVIYEERRKALEGFLEGSVGGSDKGVDGSGFWSIVD